MAGKLPNSTLTSLPTVTIKLGGSELPASYLVYEIAIRQSIYKISKASVTILGGNSFQNSFEESEKSMFEPGVEIEVSMGYDQKNTLVFKGIISKHSLKIESGYEKYNYRNKLVLECADKALKMTLEKKSEIFEKKKDSEIITAILADSGVSKEVDSTDYKHEFLTQFNITDWDFLLKRAKANGLLVLNANNKVTVAKAAIEGSPSAKVIYGDGVISFDGEVDSTRQLQNVETKSWDLFKEKEVKQTGSEPPGLSQPGNLSGKKLGKVFSPSKISQTYNAPIESGELKSLADAILVESRMTRVRGMVSFRGVPEVKLGGVITLSGFGARFEGDVMVTSVTHEMYEGNYVTKVGFGLPHNAFEIGLLEDSFPLLNAMDGLYPAIVTKIDGDPNNDYRVQVKIPALKESGNGLWARQAQLYATQGAGSFFIPEVNSEVIVGFIHNDPRFPVILGALYNSNNKPYQEIISENPKKAIVSKEKLMLEFDDKDKILTVETPGGNSLVLSDQDKAIEIKDANGNSIKMSSSGIEIKSSKAVNIKSGQKVAIEGGTGIEIKASGGDVSVKGLNVQNEAQIKFSGKGTAQAELNASGQVTVKGAVVMIN